MNQALKLFISASALSLLAACGNNSVGTDAASIGKNTAPVSPTALSTLPTAVDAFRPTLTTELAQEGPLKTRDLKVSPLATNVDLGAPLASQTANARQNNETAATDQMGKPLQIGFGREVAQTATALATNQVLKWQASQSGGQVAAINFNSSGAKGMRLGLLVTQLPATATLRFYAKGATTAFEVQGSVVLTVLAKNLAAGDKTDQGRTYWAPAVDGADATIEIEIPLGVETNSVVISIPTISHIFMSTKQINAATAQINYTGDTNAGLVCQVDVKCSSPIPAATDAVVHLRYNKDGGTYICSGTMLNDSISSSTPFLLTANHCIDNQTVASTLTTWFKYRSTTCNNGSTGEYYPLTGGADLLYTAYATDSTLVKLSVTPTVSGVLYAGWDANPPLAQNVHSIHHPKGDQQRLSRGSITGYSTRDSVNANTFFSSNVTNGTILDVTLTTGLTEGGSSGSGLFRDVDSNPKLIGQLFGGSTPGNAVNGYAPACSTSNPSVAMPPNNVYGRFDVAYYAGMSNSLSPKSNVYRFYNYSSGIHFLTTNVANKNSILANYPEFAYEGSAFQAETMLKTNTSPVHRFYNTSNGSYFYTISEKERAAVASNTPRMRYDGVVWYAYATQLSGTAPVYSAFNSTTGSQYFTTVFADRAGPNSQFKADGIAFYVTP